MKEKSPFEFITIDPKEAPLKEVHNLMLGGVAPRPIALVSTISADGINNLSPFSFFNAFGANPPYLAFSPSFSGRDGSAKDTLKNVQAIPECVVHAVTYDIVQQISLASTPYPAEVDEIIKSGFTTLESDLVRPKRIQESPFQMECKVQQIIPLGGTNGSGNLVLCEVLKFHVDRNCLTDGIIDPHAIDLIGRNSSNYYTRASGQAIFDVPRPKSLSIGIDQLPTHIKESKVLTANHLGQLGGLEVLPDTEEVKAFMGSFDAQKDHDGGDLENLGYEELYLAAYSIISSNRKMGRELIEKAAAKALDGGDVHFAVKALLSMGMV